MYNPTTSTNLTWTGLDELHERLHRDPESVAYLTFVLRRGDREAQVGRFDYCPDQLDELVPPEGFAVYAEAAFDAFVATAAEQARGAEKSTFRIRAYGPKAGENPWNLRVAVEDSSVHEELDPRDDRGSQFPVALRPLGCPRVSLDI